MKETQQKEKIERSWEKREGREVKEGAGGADRGWGENKGERGGNGRRGGCCAWVEDLPVNCAVASRVIGARLSERAWNSTPRGSARVHTLSVQDPCPSVSVCLPWSSIYRETQKNVSVTLHSCMKMRYKTAMHKQMHLLNKQASNVSLLSSVKQRTERDLLAAHAQYKQYLCSE